MKTEVDADLLGRNNQERAALAKLLEETAHVWESLRTLQRSRGSLKVLVASCLPGEGASTVAVATALGLCRNFREEVVLVDANLARPSLGSEAARVDEPGLVGALEGAAHLPSSLREVAGVPGLKLLGAGTAGGQHPGVFSAPGAEQAWSQLGEHPFTIIDGGALMPGTSSHPLLERVDAVVLVARARSTPKVRLEEASTLVESFGTHLLGVVLNRYSSDIPFSSNKR